MPNKTELTKFSIKGVEMTRTQQLGKQYTQGKTAAIMQSHSNKGKGSQTENGINT